MKIICQNIQDLPLIAKEILQLYPRHRVFALRGQMGAGKTTFMHAMAEVLGSKSEVSSPTFAIVNQYDLPENTCIYHFDCYRLRPFQHRHLSQRREGVGEAETRRRSTLGALDHLE